MAIATLGATDVDNVANTTAVYLNCIITTLIIRSARDGKYCVGNLVENVKAKVKD